MNLTIFKLIIICIAFVDRAQAQNFSEPISSTTTTNPFPEECVDACDQNAFCDHNQFAADPTDCHYYYWCVHNKWQRKACADELEFDIDGCECNFPNQAQCQPECPSVPPKPTYEPGACNDIPEPCENEKKYADVSSCEHYYLCNGGTLARIKCAYGGQHGVCTVGLPCVFDIYQEQCRNVDGDFDCDYRCLTTAITSTVTPTGITDDNNNETTTAQIILTSTHMLTTQETITSDSTPTTAEYSSRSSHMTTEPDNSSPTYHQTTTESEASSQISQTTSVPEISSLTSLTTSETKVSSPTSQTTPQTEVSSPITSHPTSKANITFPTGQSTFETDVYSPTSKTTTEVSSQTPTRLPSQTSQSTTEVIISSQTSSTTSEVSSRTSQTTNQTEVTSPTSQTTTEVKISYSTSQSTPVLTTSIQHTVTGTSATKVSDTSRQTNQSSTLSLVTSESTKVVTSSPHYNITRTTESNDLKTEQDTRPTTGSSIEESQDLEAWKIVLMTVGALGGVALLVILLIVTRNIYFRAGNSPSRNSQQTSYDSATSSRGSSVNLIDEDKTNEIEQMKKNDFSSIKTNRSTYLWRKDPALTALYNLEPTNFNHHQHQRRNSTESGYGSTRTNPIYGQNIQDNTDLTPKDNNSFV